LKINSGLRIGRKYSGIIFDFNGVLWWDRVLQEQAWRRFAKQQFGISLTDELLETEVHGRNNRHTLEFLSKRELDKNEVRQLSEQKESYYRDLCLALGDEFKLSPGAEILLNQLAAYEIPRTIATASGKENVDFFREQLLLDRWFDPREIVYDDGSNPGKPAPEVYLQAAKRLLLQPAACIVVEDSLSGIQSARSAGIGYVVAVSSGENVEHKQIDGVDQVINNLGGLDWKSLLS
jgi:HAD superfamily hydrolase (TIGR01509 family)